LNSVQKIRSTLLIEIDGNPSHLKTFHFFFCKRRQDLKICENLS
jgi:hypothetical protein